METFLISFPPFFLSFLTWLYILSTHETVGLIFFTVRGKERVSYPSLFFSEDQKLVEVFRQKRGRNFLKHLHFAPQSHKIIFFFLLEKNMSLSLSLDTRSKHLLQSESQQDPDQIRFTTLFSSPTLNTSSFSLIKPSHWMSPVSLRHLSVRSLVGGNVNLRCPRVHFHSACSCTARSLLTLGKPLLSVVPGQAWLGRDKISSTYTTAGRLPHPQAGGFLTKSRFTRLIVSNQSTQFELQ